MVIVGIPLYTLGVDPDAAGATLISTAVELDFSANNYHDLEGGDKRQ